VLPESEDDMLFPPASGWHGTKTIAGVYLPLETVEPARFDLPDPAQVGDHRSCRLLRDAVRLASAPARVHSGSFALSESIRGPTSSCRC